MKSDSAIYLMRRHPKSDSSNKATGVPRSVYSSSRLVIKETKLYYYKVLPAIKKRAAYVVCPT